MEECKELGLTKSIGVSNFNEKQIERVLAHARIRPVANEIEVSIKFHKNDTLNMYNFLLYIFVFEFHRH